MTQRPCNTKMYPVRKVRQYLVPHVFLSLGSISSPYSQSDVELFNCAIFNSFISNQYTLTFYCMVFQYPRSPRHNDCAGKIRTKYFKYTCKKHPESLATKPPLPSSSLTHHCPHPQEPHKLQTCPHPWPSHLSTQLHDPQTPPAACLAKRPAPRRS